MCSQLTWHKITKANSGHGNKTEVESFKERPLLPNGEESRPHGYVHKKKEHSGNYKEWFGRPFKEGTLPATDLLERVRRQVVLYSPMNAEDHWSENFTHIGNHCKRQRNSNQGEHNTEETTSEGFRCHVSIAWKENKKIKNKIFKQLNDVLIMNMIVT